MIETALFFILGFLCAVFIGLFIAPALFRLSYRRSRKDVEATLPLTLDEINAKTDGLRAHYAAETACLEMRIKQLEEECALQKITLGKNRQQLKRAPELEQTVTTLQKDKKQLENERQERESTMHKQHQQLTELQLQYTQLQQLHTQLKEFSNVTRLELAANETNNDNLRSQIAELRRSHKDFDMRENKLKAEMTATQTALNNEKQKNARLEERLARLISLLTDSEEKLSRISGKDKIEDDIREELQNIAAEMVLISADKEGEQSPVHAILQKAATTSALANANKGRKAKPRKKTSLSKRIDTLSRSR